MAFKKSKIFVLMVVWVLTACGVQSDPETHDLPQKVMPSEMDKLCSRLYRKNIRGKRVSWKGAVPVTFSFDSSFPPDFVPAVKSAINSWNKAAGFELFRAKEYRAGNSLPANDGQNTFYFLNNDERGSALRADVKSLFREDGSVAVTQLYYRANQIIDTDIIFDGIANSFSNSRFHLNSFDVEAIALHELGHALGLMHNDENPFSTMFYADSPLSFSFRMIDSTSEQMLDCEYK